MPGLYADHGESGWYNQDIVDALQPKPFDPTGHMKYSIGGSFSASIPGLSVSASGKAEEKNQAYRNQSNYSSSGGPERQVDNY